MAVSTDQAREVGAMIEAVAAEFAAADLHYGHGTDNPLDEAAALVYFVCNLDHADGAGLYRQSVDQGQRRRIRDLVARRIATRKPLAYLTGEAWFAGLRFAIDERVLVPRSPLAELIAERFEPWLDRAAISRVLEIGTGSGCIAIACARALPAARVVATDSSPAALEVARMNAEQHGVSDRLTLVETDHAAGVSGRFDLVITNPPYVPTGEAASLPPEYAHEPALGLYSGADGLDSARRILQDAPLLLSEQGALVIEVGAQQEALERAFPTLPFIWLEFSAGGEGVGMLRRQDFMAG